MAFTRDGKDNRLIGKLPPTGAPIGMLDMVASVRGAWSWNKTRPLESALMELTGRKYALAVGSGRMAIAMLLGILSEKSDRDRVIVPGYTCFTVAAAIARTDLKVDPVDINPETLDFDYDKLLDRDWSRVLAVVPSSLLGFPADLPRLEKIAAEKNVHLIDDACQCMGASIGGRPCGSFGMAGVFSLGRGKNISAGGGGVLVTDDDDLFKTITEQVVQAPASSDMEAFVKSSAYSLFLRPSLYGIATRLPFVEVGASHFDPRFGFFLPSGVQRALAARKIQELPALNEVRRKAAGHYDELIDHHKSIGQVTPHQEAEPVYLRYPVRVSRQGRGRVFRLLEKEGLGASVMYPEPVNRIPGISAHLAQGVDELAQSDKLSRSLLTLPTHPFVTAKHRMRIIDILRSNLRER